MLFYLHFSIKKEDKTIGQYWLVLVTYISKINNKFRYRLIIKCKNTKRFRGMISELLIEFGKDKKYNDVTISVDINPESLV